MFMGAFGEKTRTITASTEVPLPGNAKLNLALVLDTTNSMVGERVATLKTATGALLTELAINNETENNVKVSLVPFSDYVRISTSNSGEPWLETQPDKTVTWEFLDVSKSQNCTTVTELESDYTTCETPVYTETSHDATWEGCMGSRRDGFHKIADFQGRRLQGFVAHAPCGGHYNEVEPLTSDLSSLNEKVQALQLYGRTYLPSGLIWGWRTLSPNAPFTESASDDKSETNQAILLMTDGSNTTAIHGELDDFNRYYHWERRNEPELQRTL